MQIGPYVLPSPVVLAPMAGVTDRPFRILCRKLGAGLAASEMLTSDTGLWNTAKSRVSKEPGGRAGAARGSTRGRRSANRGRSRAAQCRPRRADHRSEHGL